jgi:hypothetical protein
VANAGITIEKYYGSFKSLQGVLAAGFCIIPLASNWILSGRIFPPLGNETILAQGLTALLGLAVTFLVFLLRDSSVIRIRRRIMILFVVAVLCCCAYVGLHFRFVRVVEIPSASTEAIVSVGYERSSFIDAAFPGATDSDVLNSRGFTEDEISRIWTTRSIWIARLVLISTFLGWMLALVGMASLGVLLHARGE